MNGHFWITLREMDNAVRIKLIETGRRLFETDA